MNSAARNAICLCVDSRMMIPAMFVADSVLKMSPRAGGDYDLFIFCEPGEATDAQRDWMTDRGVIMRDDMDLSPYHAMFDAADRVSAATLIRLFLPRILENSYERILYLDADLTIHGDVARIFSIDLGDHAFAAVQTGTSFETEKKRQKAEGHFAELGMSRPYRFFNSGVLLIDTRKWLDRDISKRALAFYRDNAQICVLPDEDALNATMDGDFCGLSPLWNANPSRSPMGMANAKPVIVHHMGSIKPWRLFSRGRPFSVSRYYYGLYREFLRGTPWEDWLARQWTRKDILKCLEWTVINAGRQFTRRRERAAHSDKAAAYWQNASFADLEQGIIVRDGGVMRLGD